MADPFATTDDLAARWRPLSPAEETRAAVLLADASAIVRAEFPDVDGRLGAVPPTLDVAIPGLVVCSMVKRAMVATADMAGVSSQQQSAGPYSLGLTFANPTGDLYITKAERRMLGGGQRAFTIDTTPPDAYADYCDPTTWVP